jgi:cytochrome d ubiquinol oxidase subunit I
MVGMGLVVLALSWNGVFLWRRGRLDHAHPFLLATFLAFPSGFIAVITGWYVAEIGRQPWAIYGVMRTIDALTPSLTGGQVLATLIAYIAVYTLIFAAGILYIYRLLEAGPAPGPEPALIAGDAPPSPPPPPQRPET